MNNLQQINWDSQDVLLQIVDNIQAPLMAIINSSSKPKENNRRGTKKSTNELILKSSKQIADIIDELVKKIENKKIKITKRIKKPRLFTLIEKNEKIQRICCRHKSLEKITKADWEWLLEFEDEIIKNIDDSQYNLFDLSYTLAVSERQLYRKVKELLGITPNKYIRIIKLNKAKQLLENCTYDMVSETSYAVGYNDPYYFSKLFSEIYDITPTEIIRKDA